jgi:thiosulfate/3-mercaptopyruvate sulfurtransferase
MWADKAEVLRCIHDEKVCTMNALQPDVYDGSMERYGRAGHIPGSLNVFSDDLFDAQTGELLPVEELRKKFEHARPFDRRTIVYCGGGVSATLNAIALEMLGHQNVAVYDGSMYEWCADPSLPLVLGAEPG